MANRPRLERLVMDKADDATAVLLSCIAAAESVAAMLRLIVGRVPFRPLQECLADAERLIERLKVALSRQRAYRRALTALLEQGQHPGQDAA